MKVEPFKVFLCGGKGSGKTVFLSALLHRFVSPDRDNGLICDMAQATYVQTLSAIYNDLTEHWPEGTRLHEQHEIEFEFYVSRPGSAERKHCADILFYDFAGEILSETKGVASARSERAEQLDELINSCDAVVAILNGSLVRDSIKNGSLTPQLRHEITVLIHKLSRKEPINTYWMISKWDMFEDSDATISQIRDILMRFGPFESHAIHCVEAGHPVRIIPVSSVGYGFAKPSESNTNVMVVTEGAEPRPYNVEIPIACVIPDRIEKGHKDRAGNLENTAKLVEHLKPDWWKRALEGIAGWAENSPLVEAAADRIGVSYRDVTKYTGMLRDPANADRVSKKRVADDLRGQVRTDRDAMNYATAIFKDIITEFETQYPSSTIRIS